MSACGCDFWRSVRGIQLVDRTLTQLVVELRRLNDHLDREQSEKREAPRAPQEDES